MKTIATLTQDIYSLLSTENHKEATDSILTLLSDGVTKDVSKTLSKRVEKRELGKLWASDIGQKCHRKMWYTFNQPNESEKLSGNTLFKFLYGNLLEELVLYYAEEAGHTVTNRQTKIEHKSGDWTVAGKIDAIIDDVLIDVKSTSSYGYKQYEHGINDTNDTFGYLKQLGYYQRFQTINRHLAACGFIWIDKQNGHIKYSPAIVENKEQLETRIINLTSNIEKKKETDVRKHYHPEPYGKSGNMILPMACSYCSFKKHCWRDSNKGKGLRNFIYKHRPVWFTRVKREPNTIEVKV